MTFWRRWRKKKIVVKPESIPPPEETSEETTGEHQVTLDIIRGTRASVGDLIQKLGEIKHQAEEIVHSGDLPTRKGGDDER